MTPDDELMSALRALRAEYLLESPARLAELWTALERVQNGDGSGLESLRILVHRLAGSGGGYGLPQVTDAARAADVLCRELLATEATPAAPDLDRLRAAVQGIADAFARAQRDV